MFVVILISLFFILLYYKGTKNFHYWEKKGIKYCKPVPFFGNSFKKYFRCISPTDQLADIYRSYPEEKCVGFFEANHQALVLRDPELIKRVLVTDFQHFYPKGMNMHQTEPLMNNLFSADGDLWRLLRQKLSVAFSTGKLKSMFPVLLEQAARLEKIVCDASENYEEVDVRDLAARFTTDSIVACGLGVDTNSLNDDSSVFRKLGKRIFDIKLRDQLVFMSKCIAPDTFKDFKFFAPEIESVITEIVKSIFETRKNKGIDRRDFIDVLLQLQSKKCLTGASFKRDENGVPEQCEVVLDDMLLIAQAFILFAAGYETTGAAMSYALHELAYNQDIQKKCQKEIDEVLKKHGKMCYEAVCDMKYLEMTLKESLRMYPPIGFLIRQCAANYTFPETGMSIDRGVTVLIPLQAIHNDEKYFEQPDKFIPERFDSVKAERINKFSFLPFGAGPRTCLGEF